MAQVSERHHHMSQLGAAAVAPPGKQGSFPPPAPALYHFENEETTQPRVSEEPSEKHHHTSQLGETAVAPPGGVNGLPPPVPALHHLGDDHSAETQVGPSAIAPPTGEIVHPASIPAQYHLNEDEDKSNQSPIKPFQYHAQDQNSSSPNSRSAPPSDCHTSESQLGAAAIAAPSYTAKLPPPIPELHHIKDDHNHETQLGQPAIAPPASFVANPHQTNDVEEQEDLTFPGLLPFPKDIPTAPLLRISLAKLLSNDASETNKVWRASRDLGFFYLDLRNAESTSISGPSLLSDIDALFSLGEALFALPTSEKQKFDFVDKGSYFGYKGLGAGIIDKTGTRDRNEFYNVSKDDILGISSPLPAPDILQQQSSRDLLASYMQKSHAIVTLLLGILNTKLGLPENELQSLHRLQAPSGDQARWVNTPAQPEDDRQKSLGEHTDFGTLTLLSNRLGGLQILPPSSPSSPNPEWTYVLPLPHHLIINLGDALVRFTASLLRSNIHRVVNPPGTQAGSQRMSLVYFSRPENDVLLKALVESEVVRETKEKMEDGKGGEEEDVTAKEWILRRALQRRVGGDYEKSEGTEGGRN